MTQLARSRSRWLRLTGAARSLALLGLGLPGLLGLMAGSAAAQQQAEILPRPTLNFYGATGLVDMPTAEHQPDGYLSATISYFGQTTRSTVSFQITPWLSGSFRYSGIDDWNTGASTSTFPTFYDRSFDLRIRLMQESGWRPTVTLGFQDFVGTGLYSAEYLVATKGFGPQGQVKVTAGLGWGRLAGVNVIGSTGTRSGSTASTGGQLNSTDWFRGDVSLFGGVEWLVNDRLSLKAEYSTDDYDEETQVRSLFERRSSVNLGFSYRINNATELGGYYMYGDTVGLMLSFATDPAARPYGGGRDAAPRPVAQRPTRSAPAEVWSAGWAASAARTDTVARGVEAALAAEGLELLSVGLAADRVQVRFVNPRYDATAQALGRAARGLSAVLPASVEIITLVPVSRGLASTAVTFRRSDLEALENTPEAAEAMLAVTGFTQVPPLPGTVWESENSRPRFSWALEPYTRVSYFDPDAPIRGDFGLRLRGSYRITPNLYLAGSIRKRLFGNLDENSRSSNSVLPRVRSDFAEYDKQGDPALETLTAAYYFQPRDAVYGRVTVGYLEQMFGGISTELLWMPVDSRVAFGGELNWVRQRDFDMRFGFQDYSVLTGHLSAYWDLNNGFYTQVDAGRYLAGDYGATLTVTRQFANGWEIGAFATLTDVSAEDFGEGSFDKGILFTIPISWLSGRPTRAEYSLLIRPVTRDGGARLNVDDRLYETIRDYGQISTTERWGRFWR